MAVRMVDTNIVSYYVKRHPLAAKYLPHTTGYVLAVSFQTVAELWLWADLAGWGTARRAHLAGTLAGMLTYQSTPTVCDCWVEIQVARQSRPISTADAWIAATALAHGFDLVTHNPADFAGIPGLTVISEAP